jgi:2-polyprenyl-6-methoxyphenol hydroxylase-like FAD-dependent oxidoreductase
MDSAEENNISVAKHRPPDAEPQSPANAFDVIVVGAGLAGCAAARLFALGGLRVVLVEHHRDTFAYKQLCTHFIQASATPTLRRLGLDVLIEGAGGVRNGVDMWTRYGWTGDLPPLDSDGKPAFGYNIQRRTLDPMLRNLAAGTPGLTFLSGCSVRKLIEHDGAVGGIELEGAHPGILRAHVVVGADGRNSALAKLAQVKASSSENSRFAAIRAYRKVALRRGTCSQMWLRGAETGYVFPNDDAVTVVAYMATKDKLDGFRSDPGHALERSMADFPDCPDLAAAEPLGETLLIKDYPNMWRTPVAGNIAFIGDALMSMDPLWGVGCGFAFQTAEWLVDALAPVLKVGQAPAPALKRYAKQVSRRLGGHRFLINDYARRRGFNTLERLAFSAAAKDSECSRHLHAFGARMIGPAQFLSPTALLRAAWINLRRPAALTAQPDASV